MTNHPETCFACGEGHYTEVIEDYRLDLPDGDTLTVPKLHILRCDKCGEDTIPPEFFSENRDGCRSASRHIASNGDSLFFWINSRSTRLRRQRFSAWEARTFHRWARGTQRVSRSMGYFLRAVMAHPVVFDWIRDRRVASRRSENE